MANYAIMRIEKRKLGAVGRICNHRCLCGKCLNDYKSNPAYIIRRLDPFENIKHQCDKCSGSGYDYIIYDRSSVRR